MKINQISISQYKSLGRDVKIRFLSNQVVLVGRNEAGKSNVLEALSGLRIFKDMGNDVLPLANTNRTLNENNIEVAIKLEFDANDVSLLDDIVSIPDEERVCEIVISREANGLMQKLGCMFSGIIKRDSVLSSMCQHIQGLLSVARKINFGDNSEYRAFNFWLENYDEYYIPNLKRVVLDWCVNHILPHVSEKAVKENHRAIIVKFVNRLDELYAKFRKIVPMFFRFYDEFELHSTYRLDEIKNPRNYGETNLLGLDRYLGAIGLEREDVIYALTNSNQSLRKGKQSQFILKTEQIVNEFNDTYLNGSAKVRIMPSFDGDVLSFAVVSDGLYDTVLMGERSTGLRWYLNVFFELKRANAVRNYVLLIDEPAIHMHVNAQREVLNLFDSLANGSRYLLFTTHSPYMIDVNHMENVKAIIKDNGVARISDIHCSRGNKGAQDAWTPVCEALGVSLRYNVGPCGDRMNLICEGPSDACYISAMMDFLGISEVFRPNVIAAMGVRNIHNIAAILLGWGCEICVLLDNDSEGATERRRLLKYFKDMNVNSVRIVYVDESAGATIESLISTADCEKLLGDNSTCEELRGNKILNACMFAKQIRDRTFSPDGETQDNFSHLFANIGVDRTLIEANNWECYENRNA